MYKVYKKDISKFISMYVQSLQGIFIQHIQHMGFHCIPRKTNKNVGLLIQIILSTALSDKVLTVIKMKRIMIIT